MSEKKTLIEQICVQTDIILDHPVVYFKVSAQHVQLSRDVCVCVCV